MTAPRLTIGMAVCDDFDGIYFTLTSLMIHHAQALQDCSFVVVDNHPDSRQGRAVKAWVARSVPKGAYFALPAPFGTAPARNEVFRRADGECVLCIDCHVLLAPGAIQRLLSFYDSHPDCADLLTGPLLYDDGTIAATHQRDQWSNGSWGVWSIDERGVDADGDPFEIWQQGMGLFSCRKDTWVGFHPEFRGFGGCESYVMEKFRRQGGRVLCCPWLRWTHRFQRPLGVPYRVSRLDSQRNYRIGFRELGIDPEPMEQHYAELAQAPSRTASDSQPPETEMSIGIFGDARLGSVKMRGETLADHYQVPLLNSMSPGPMPHRDVAIVVKDGVPALRNAAGRLIYDPLDVFWDTPHDLTPREFWRRKYDQLHFDDIIATSPACEEVMRDALPKSVQVHLIPHQSDNRVYQSWHDSDGPVVYAGQSQFLSDRLDVVSAACRMIGKELVVDRSFDVLKGASLALALRLPPYDTSLNRFCKPQVKIENAIAAGVPVVTTDCPAALSLYPGIASVPVSFSARQLADSMRRAMESPPPWKPFRAENFISAIDRLLGRQSTMVFTCVYGNSGFLVDPGERAAGVQYLCLTDNPRLTSNVWSIRWCAPSSNPLMQAKQRKILAHESLDCDLSLWVDSRLQLCSLQRAFESLSADVAFPRHAVRDCIYDEASHCKSIRRGNPSLIDSSIARYRSEAHPLGYGLWDTDIILRRHNEPAKSFNNEWWQEVSTATPQDQISLPVILRRLSVAFETLPNNRPSVAPAIR